MPIVIALLLIPSFVLTLGSNKPELGESSLAPGSPRDRGRRMGLNLEEYVRYTATSRSGCIRRYSMFGGLHISLFFTLAMSATSLITKFN